MLIFFPPSLKLHENLKICYRPLMHPVFFSVAWHSFKGSLGFNSIDGLSTWFDHLHLQTALQSSTLGTFCSTISNFSVSRQARTALPNGLILILLFGKRRALNFNLGHGACCDYVLFSSALYLEFTFYLFLSSVRSQPAVEYTRVDLIMQLSKTFVSSTELHPSAAFCYQRPVSKPLHCVSSFQGSCKQRWFLHHSSLAASHSVWACVFNCTLHSFSTY